MRTAKSGEGFDNDRAIAAEEWNRIVEGLSRLDSPEDRALADHVVRFLSGAFAIDSKRQREVGPERQENRQTLVQGSGRKRPRAARSRGRGFAVLLSFTI